MEGDIRLFEVGPRDGLQNEEAVVDTADRVEMVERLAKTGVADIEIGSFVHPDWVPQMEGTDRVAEAIADRDDVRYWALVPNMRGLEDAIDAGVGHVAVFMSATETHNRKNLNRSVVESLESLEETMSRAGDEGMGIRAYISMAFGCPFEGDVDFERVLEIGDRLLEMGAEHLSIGDTIGVGTPPEIRRGCRRALEEFGRDRVSLHLHDTQGLALANALVAYQEGVRMFDGAVGGMGGCPYAPGAAGNVATEDLINMFEQLGAETGVDLDAMTRVSRWLDEELEFAISGRYYPYWRAQTDEESR